MHRAVIAAAVTGLCSPLLFGCDGDTAKADPTTTPTTASVSLPSPITTPPPTTTPATTVTPPPLAKRKSVPGAKAFVRYYIGAINSSTKASSSAVVRRLSTTECITCRGIASSMDEIRRNHGFYRGGDWLITSVVPIPLQTLRHPIIHTAITISAGVWKRSPSDHVRRIEAERMYVDVHLRWATTNWIVTSIVSA